MRLLNVKSLELVQFRNDQRPKYVAASHRWVEGSEATFKDVRKRRNTESIGHKKVQAFAKYVRDNARPVEWLWIDTCCINQEDAAELSEAVNLMFQWYRDAEICLAYLADVKAAADGSSFEQSEWFRRGWTLQELLAPRIVVFLTDDWQVIGNKGAAIYPCSINDVGLGLESSISRITGISEQVLHDYTTSTDVSEEVRMQWMNGRQTSRVEDMSYALYGIFGVSPGANYGEGYDGARQRLFEAIRHRQNLVFQKAERFRTISAWVSAPDPWTNHESARRRHEPFTGTWLLEAAQYQSWKSGSTRHLWVHGKAGCGKTVLCSTAIEDVQRHCETAANVGYAIFYFSFSDNQKQSYDNLLRSLVVQLGWREPGLSTLQKAYDRTGRSLPSLDELEAIVLSSIESYDYVFLLLDAFDECPEDGEVRWNVLEYLERLAQSAPKLRILATSREVADVRETMEILGGVAIVTEMQPINADIRKYVSTQLSCDRKLRRLDSATRVLVEETISQGADGMFRWAYCQLQELKTLPSLKRKYVKETLRSLPPTLDGTYERMLTGIKQMFRQEALVLLRWLAYAESPLSLEELAEAVIVDPTGGGRVELGERGALEDTLEILSGLVMVQEVGIADDSSGELGRESEASVLSESEDNDRSNPYSQPWAGKDTKVRLAHFSVKEYLESRRILRGEAHSFYLESATEHRFLAQSCLTYLLFYSESSEKSSTKQDLITFPLLRYAARSWAYHSPLQRSGELVREMSLLRSEVAMSDWVLVYQPDQPWEKPFQYPSPIKTALYYASSLGLDEVVNQLLTTGSDVNARGGKYGNALQAASWGGHEKVVHMLLNAGAEMNAQGEACCNALQAASWGGHEKVVRILLDAGAEINARGGLRGSALQAASWAGRVNVVQLLIDTGADVNVQGGEYGNALQAASSGGHEKIVQMLLDVGAAVNAQGGEHGTALHAASYGGYEKLVQMLLRAGAEVNLQGGMHGNALQAASQRSHEKVVRMLLNAGADVNALGGIYGNALQAAKGRKKKVMQMLMEAGALDHVARFYMKGSYSDEGLSWTGTQIFD